MENKSLILLEFNEVSFNYVERYVQQGKLKNFKKFIEECGISKTHSEENMRILNLGFNGSLYIQEKIIQNIIFFVLETKRTLIMFGTN